MRTTGPDWTAPSTTSSDSAPSPGLPEPPGVSFVPAAATGPCWNFSLATRHATRVTLLLFAADDLRTPLRVIDLDPAIHRIAAVWCCRLPAREIESAAYYAYRLDGPSAADSDSRHAFDRDKLLLDPYAREIFFPPDFDRAAAMRPGDNADKAPIAVFPRRESAITDARHQKHAAPSRSPASPSSPSSTPPAASPAVSLTAPPSLFNPHDDISSGGIYELHVRGFTRSESSSLPPARRGTFAGLIDTIPYLKDLGISAVELMPVFQFDPQEGNYWGYMPISFFAVHQQYASDPKHAAREFRTMADALHDAGIALLIDSVQNHTGEGRLGWPTYSWRGIDHASYYMQGHAGRRLSDFTGCGNTFNIRSPEGRRLVVDSLRYWSEDLGVDGFRHDLAAVAARREDGSLDPDPPILAAIAACRELARKIHIVEPWDFEGAYLAGAAFPARGARQWNAKFRDDLRRFVRGDRGLVGTLMQRLYGSDDLFPDRGEYTYSPRHSVNYIASHDGFTLHDLLSYTRRRNEANGHHNTDGPSDEFSWNAGHEGEVGASPAVVARRERDAMNLLTLLFLAAGTPMIRMGDEFLHTQLGNNNPYNQDNAVTWLDWSRRALFRRVWDFTRGLIAFRRAHPSLWRPRFWRDDITWHGADGPPDLSERSLELAYHLRGASVADDDLYVLINMGPADRPFRIPSPGPWRLALDTASARASASPAREPAEPVVTLPPRSIQVLVAQASRL